MSGASQRRPKDKKKDAELGVDPDMDVINFMMAGIKKKAKEVAAKVKKRKSLNN